ncbi:hypothetical protein PASLES2_32630 [Pseudomonas aeruginosa]
MLDKLHLFVLLPRAHPTARRKRACGSGARRGSAKPGRAAPRADQPRGGRRATGGLLAAHLGVTSTGFTPLAFKVFHQSLGKRLMPGVELKASPGEVAPGAQRVWPNLHPEGGRGDVQVASPLPGPLREARCVSDAGLHPGLHVFQPAAGRMHALQVIQALTNVSNGHTKSRGDNYQTSAYWGAKESRLSAEGDSQAHRVSGPVGRIEAGRAGRSVGCSGARVMSDPRLQEWVRYLLRMQVTGTHRWLERRGIPSRLVDLIAYQQRLQEEGRCLIQECWQAVTADLFAAFEGIQMRVIDDEKVLAALLEKHTKEGKGKWTKAKVDPSTGVTIPPVFVPGKPNDSYALNLFYIPKPQGLRVERDDGVYGSPNLLRPYPGHLRCGPSKAALQKLHEADRANNVVPLLRFVQVDFSAQRPDWYVEPTPGRVMLVATLETLALLAFAVTVIHAVGVWARSDGWSKVAHQSLRWDLEQDLSHLVEDDPGAPAHGPGHAPSRPGTGRRGRSPAAHQPRLQDVPAPPGATLPAWAFREPGARPQVEPLR